MVRFALFDYFPQRRIRRASFDILDRHRMILGFKDGRKVYTDWAARQFAAAMAHMDLHDITIVCVPASTRYSHVRRWKRFSHLLCSMTGAVNGFDRVQVCGGRSRAHVTGEYELATNINDFIHVDDGFFRGRKVLVIDDICTSGRSSAAFIAALQASGATVTMAVFLAKTKRF